MTVRRRLIGAAALLALPTRRAPGTADLVAAESGSLPIVLTAPHGGEEAVPGVEPREVAGKPAGGSGYVITRDGGTEQLAHGVALEIRRITGRGVHLVVARFHRKYIDANRPTPIAFDGAAARPYYERYHEAVRRFVDEVRSRFAAGLLIDIHGQRKMPDDLMRGTLDGRSVSRLLARAGPAAIVGPRGLFGQLERQGFRIFPGNDLPLSGRTEDRAFNGGYTVARYGSHRADGIDAVQFEFGSRYRQPGELERSITRMAGAIAAFHEAYLR